MTESLKRKFQTLANQQPGTGNPNIPPLVAKAKEIREAINISAGGMPMFRSFSTNLMVDFWITMRRRK
jgi:hypothetical protein